MRLQEMCERGMAPGVEHFNSAILACENSDKFTPAAMFLFESMLTQAVILTYIYIYVYA